jgi:hypothetical protein
MTAVVLVALGAVLCLAGARSARLAVLVSGFGAAWIVADAFGASLTTTLLISLAGAALVFLVTLFISSVLFFVAGAVAGAVIGAKLYVLLAGGDSSVLLAVVFVPAVAAVFGYLGHRLRRPFLVWATAFGGAALVLTGLAMWLPADLALLTQPQDSLGYVILALAWVGLALVGALAQQNRPLWHGRTGGRPAHT